LQKPPMGGTGETVEIEHVRTAADLESAVETWPSSSIIVALAVGSVDVSA
jgi:hypothetical protein